MPFCGGFNLPACLASLAFANNEPPSAPVNGLNIELNFIGSTLWYNNLGGVCGEMGTDTYEPYEGSCAYYNAECANDDCSLCFFDGICDYAEELRFRGLLRWK